MMKRLFVVILVLCFTAIVALEAYVRSDVFATSVRNYVVGPLQEILGPDAHIGSVKANLFPPYLEVGDIILHDSHGKVAASIRKVTIYINPLPLVFKHIHVPSILILEPRFNIERTPDRAVNVLPLIDRINANFASFAGRGSSGYSLKLRTITVRKAEILFRDDTLSSEASVRDINMNVRFKGANDRVAVTVRGAQVRVSAPAYPEMTGVLKTSLEFSQSRLSLHSLEITIGDTAVVLSGSIGPFPDAILDIKSTVRSGPQTVRKLIDRFKRAPRQLGPSIEASVVVKGKFASPEIDGKLKLSDLAYQGTTLEDASISFRYHDQDLTASGDNWRIVRNNKTLTIDRIVSSLMYRNGIISIRNADISSGDLTAQVSGDIGPSKGIDMNVTAISTGAGKTLSSLATLPIEGLIKIEGHLTGPLNDPVFDGAVAASALTVRGVRFNEVEGGLEYRGGKLSASSVDIRHHTSKYVLDGAVDFKGEEPVYSAHLKIIQTDVVSIVALFYKPLPLNLQAKGDISFQGTAKQYSGSGFLSLDSGAAYGESFTRGTIAAVLSTGKIAFPQVVLYKKKGIVEAAGWISFNGAYSADLEGKDIDLSAIDHLSGVPVAGASAFDIHSSGTFENPVVKAFLTVSDFSVRRISVGQVHGEAEIREGKMRLSAHLPDDSARLSILWLLHKPYAWTADVNLKTDNIKPLILVGAGDVSERLKVAIDGHITAHGTGLSLSLLSGEAVFSHISMSMGEYRIANDLPAEFSIDGGRISIRSLSFTGPESRFSVSGSTALFDDIDISLAGSGNLPLLKLIFPVVDYAVGTTEMKLTVKDNWSNPDVAGEMQIHNGEIKIHDIAQKFSALNGKITFSRDRVVTDSLSGEMGGGTFSMSGWAQFSGVAIGEFSVKTSINNVTIRYPEGLTSTLSGNLYYDGDAKEQTFSGDVLIKRARYDKSIEWKSMMVDIDRGLYQKKKADIGWIGDTQINVRFHGASNILLQNNMARLPLDIDIFLRGTVNHPQLFGRIEARSGTVYFRKNNFKINHASVDFVDPNRMNPVLDIQAETQVREYKIQLAVTGSAERAVVTLTSEPALVDTDILSLLTLGKKSSELQGKETKVGVGEAASFATGQFQDIFERQSRSLTGLDRFQIDPYVSKSDTSVPRVTVGKEIIQNKVYFTYSSNVGATAPEQTFSVEYILDKHFSLVGERDDALGNNGADIKYRFEFQ